jgi:hypothetical protein
MERRRHKKEKAERKEARRAARAAAPVKSKERQRLLDAMFVMAAT